MSEIVRRFFPKDISETEPNPVLPRVIYDASLLAPDCPYTVTFSAEQTTEVFKAFNVADKHIRRFQVNIRRSPLITPQGKTGGAYRNNRILLTTDDYWQMYLDGMKLFDEKGFSREQESDGLLDYIHAFANKVAKHEISHGIVDYHQKKEIFSAVSHLRFKNALSLLAQRPLLTHDDFEREEQLAESITRQIDELGNWKSFIQIKPKENVS